MFGAGLELFRINNMENLINKFFRKDKKINKVILFLENLSKEFQNELDDLLLLNNIDRFPTSYDERISDLDAMINVIKNIVEIIQSNEKKIK